MKFQKMSDVSLRATSGMFSKKTVSEINFFSNFFRYLLQERFLRLIYLYIVNVSFVRVVLIIMLFLLLH